MRKTILIIDDDKELGKLLQYRLNSCGYKVLVANDGDQGLQLAKKKPDLVLLDIMMPTVSGIELCQLFKEDKMLKNIPVIFLTAKETKEDQLKGISAGAEDYIVKPFDAKILLAKIRKLLEKNKR